ncbi:RNA 2',3'-cyclic phosphodiesterase [Candidatus Woesearchaeota archaeon]|nr:RNA 2',3'-cyclic phosphodiesterase [Candidatus Woesearchaeota archaeon]
MRVFIAIDMPDSVKEYLRKVQKLLPEAKMLPVRDFHLTLKFIGELTPERVEKLKNLLGNVKFEKFTASTDEVGVFPSENYVRVVWIGLKPEEPIIELQQQIEKALEGEFKQDNSFKAHLTLARVKFIGDKERFIRELKDIKTEKISFEVDRFRLKKSTLTPEGPVYADLALFPQPL